VPDIDRQIDVLEKPDTVLVDSKTRALFGPLETGRVVEIAGRRMDDRRTVMCSHRFLGLGVVLASEADFFRMFPQRPPDTVNLGW